LRVSRDFRSVVVLIAGIVAACGREQPRPERELLVITTDSTFWITASGNEVKARGVPMLVARIGGRFNELYVADDDRSYYDAVFLGHRLFARDLIRGDSIELHSDTTVARLAATYARTHPEEKPLGPDEPENDNASIRATSDIEILGIHGPYLSFEHHTDIDTRDERSADHRHEFRRGVLDARDASRLSLAKLFGATADGAVKEAHAEWNAARDSLIAMAGAGAARARRAIADFTFDQESFAIGSDGQAPTLRFAPAARGTNPDIEPIELRPRPIAAPAWWSAAAAELPLAGGDTSRWARAGDTLVVAPVSNPRGWKVSLHSAGRAGAAVRIASTVDRVIWLDSTVTDADRAALLRAFDEAANYDGARQVARLPELDSPRSPLHLARHDSPRRETSPRIAIRVFRPDDARRRECARPRIRRIDPRDARQDRGGVCDAPRAHGVRHRIG
jgi:hypothetical protein